MSKSISITKREVWEAYKFVRRNKGSAGVDHETIEDFDQNLENNLYKIWNRLCSGSYHPPPIKRVAIPKKDGSTRNLGVPTVSDRVAQQVVKNLLEPELERIFHKDSFGYRPKKSALDAVGVVRKRCWSKKWVVEFDIKGAFDNLDHELILKAVAFHDKRKWLLSYVERWLKAPVQLSDGSLESRVKGTPQGGVISPLLMNLFMHYAFDAWMVREFPDSDFVRYADDGLVNCSSKQEAHRVLKYLSIRLKECGLELHPRKTKIVYCLQGKYHAKWDNIKFDFLGYTFKPRRAVRRDGSYFMSFLPAASTAAKKELVRKVKESKIFGRTDISIKDISERVNPIILGWWNYFKKYYPSSLESIRYYLNLQISRWVRRKYKRFRSRKRASGKWVDKMSTACPNLFAHWKFKAY